MYEQDAIYYVLHLILREDRVQDNSCTLLCGNTSFRREDYACDIFSTWCFRARTLYMIIVARCYVIKTPRF